MAKIASSQSPTFHLSSSLQPIVAIVGPTGSGKSALAMDIASKYGGEIICADSRTIYKGMDIGTAKPSQRDQQAIPHHCLDLVEPNETYSAAAFKRDATAAIEQIQSRGKLPILVGGSGLYIDGLLYDFEFGKADVALRDELEKLTDEDLHARATKLGISAEDVNYKNRRHLTRAIERGGVRGGKKRLPANVLIIGQRIHKEDLDLRIEHRVDSMLEAGLVREVETLVKKWSASAPGLSAPGYKTFVQYLVHSLDLEESKTLFIRSHKQLAKRQMTWFKRNKDIHWVDTNAQAEQIIKTFIQKFATMEL